MEVQAHKTDQLMDLHGTMDEKNITLIDNLDIQKDDFTVNVRIIRLWSQPLFKDPEQLYSIEMILMDEELLHVGGAIFIKNPTIARHVSKYKLIDNTNKLKNNIDVKRSIAQQFIFTSGEFNDPTVTVDGQENSNTTHPTALTAANDDHVVNDNHSTCFVFLLNGKLTYTHVSRVSGIDPVWHPTIVCRPPRPRPIKGTTKWRAHDLDITTPQVNFRGRLVRRVISKRMESVKGMESGRNWNGMFSGLTKCLVDRIVM
ncbi:hypothetical protein OSB04_008231 [Centaurea solstitialis]|uniref:DUF223 domain-containing protein n=1 Tax=Centaurea solstitialis TaxID=347529 RepID=A0AA38TZ52_9ASTR|nr:hypothetical protein OSB04_008231 [Centaurea solstitialis]